MIIFIIVALILLFLYFKFFKLPKIGNLCLVTGGVKTGKSMLSVHYSIKRYKKNLLLTKILNFFRKLLKKEPLELPLLYSNVPLGLDYVEINEDILYMKKRCPRGSVLYVQEASLFADSQLKNDQDKNNRMLLFFKLCAHIGFNLVMIDTQQINDVHYSIKRSVSNYFYIHHSHKFLILPFVVMYLQEYLYNDENSTIVSNLQDVEQGLKRVIIPKRVWKYYNSTCYSTLVDDKPLYSNVIHSTKKSNLKATKIISFRDEFKKMLKKSDSLQLEDSTFLQKVDLLKLNSSLIKQQEVTKCENETLKKS